MANPGPLKILKQVVEACNKWRGQNLSIEPDLSKANLVKEKLSGANLKMKNLTVACFSDVNFMG